MVGPKGPNDRRPLDTQFQGLVEHSLVGMAIAQDNRFLYVNPKYCEIFGYTRDEFLKRMTVADVAADVDRALVEENIHKRLQGAASGVSYTFKGKRKDGSVIDVEFHGAVMDIDGRPALIASLMDVTERKRMEETLRGSEERFRTLIEQAPEAILVYDFDLDRFVMANQQAEKLFACSGEELLRVGPTHFYPSGQPDGGPTAETFAEHNRRVLAGEAVAFERHIRNAEGEDRLCEVRLVPLPSSHGRQMRASFIDVTERKQAERTLVKTVRALRTLSHSNGALVHATTAEGLFEEMCRVIVEVGGYRMAWIGLAENDAGKTVRAMAHAGHEAGYLDLAKISWADDARGWGPTGTAVRTGTVQINRNFASDPRMELWRAEALSRGYASSIALPLAEPKRTFGALTIYAPEPDAFGTEEVQLLTELAADLSYGVIALRTRADREAGLQRLERAMEETVEVIASTVEMRDSYTAGHQRRVAKIAKAIAVEMGISGEKVHSIHLAGIVHDVGKINVPTEILSKPGKLSAVEYELVKGHVQAGYDILKQVEFPWPIADIVVQHHERLDGSGYPNGLKGDAILLEARILAVADVVESMISHRPYRPARGLDAALAEIRQGKGRLYDPLVVEACVKVMSDMPVIE